jgi:hypothetical protein
MRSPFGEVKSQKSKVKSGGRGIIPITSSPITYYLLPIINYD